ncbi:MAG: helix-turn-helix domain-containing protein [Ruminococcus sp.]|nr:helix-turn-helix domain-containing protein [Ruminococcus sp.]
MPIKYRMNVLAELKAAGYNTNRLRKEKLLSEGTIQSIREGKIINAANLAKLCKLLKSQPGDILEYEEEQEEEAGQDI